MKYICFQLGSNILVHYALLWFLLFHLFGMFVLDLICQELSFLMSQQYSEISATILGTSQ